MSKLIRIQTTQPDDEINITWAPTNLCNFECRYCWPGANSGTHLPTKNIELAIKNVDHILSVYEERLGKKKFKINFAGGEPTLWNGLETVIQELDKNHDIYWGIITNGSRTIRWWKEYGHLFDSVQISHHVKQAKIDHTIEVADILFEKNVKITVRLMMDPSCWDECIDSLEYMKKNSKHPWFIDVAEVIEDHLPETSIPIYSDGRMYSIEQRKFLKKQNKRIPNLLWFIKNFKLLTSKKIRITESIAYYQDGSKEKARANYYMNRKLNYFEGWNCNIGLERFYIDVDGTIKGSCGQKLFDNYNILDQDFIEKFNPDLKPTICQIKNCYCGPEMHITKSIEF